MGSRTAEDGSPCPGALAGTFLEEMDSVEASCGTALSIRDT
jgi:hypothetical protein